MRHAVLLKEHSKNTGPPGYNEETSCRCFPCKACTVGRSHVEAWRQRKRQPKGRVKSHKSHTRVHIDKLLDLINKCHGIQGIAHQQGMYCGWPQWGHATHRECDPKRCNGSLRVLFGMGIHQCTLFCPDAQKSREMRLWECRQSSPLSSWGGRSRRIEATHVNVSWINYGRTRRILWSN